MLSLESVSRRYRAGNYGVRDVSLELHGGVLGLLGPNGAGKTTLIQMIATITRPLASAFEKRRRAAALRRPSFFFIAVAAHVLRLRRV